MLLTENMKWVYTFGGINDENQPIDTIERIRLNNVIDPTKDLNTQWQMLEIKLPSALMNIGCYMIPNSKEILLFGGLNEFGDMSNTGNILILENEERGIHSFSQNNYVKIEDGDTFPNTGCLYKNGDDTIVVGNNFAWTIHGREKKLTKLL